MRKTDVSANSPNRMQRRRHAREFFRGFFIALAVILPIFAAAFLLNGQIKLNQTQEIAPVEQPVADVLKAQTKSFNLLWVLTDTDGLLGVSLLRFDTSAYRIYVCEMPISTVMLYMRAPVSLSDIYRQRGTSGVQAAIEETLKVPVSGYLQLTSGDFVRLIDRLGPFDYTLDKVLDVYDEAGALQFSKSAGTSRFSGNDLAQLLRQGNYTAEENLWLREDLWRAAFSAYGDETFSAKVTAYYYDVVNDVNTDISASEVNALAAAIAAVSPKNGIVVEIVRLPGSFLDDVYELDEGADQHMWNYYSKREAAAISQAS